jgi:hypothetical protein
MHRLLALSLVTGCVVEEPPVTLASDAYFVADFVDECLANETDTRGCSFSIALCRNGRAAERIGDIIQAGHYMMEGSVAIAELDTHSFRFDVDTGAGGGTGADAYVPDTEGLWHTFQFDTIDCSASP